MSVIHTSVGEPRVSPRSDAMVNGALIAIGALGVVDNVLFHWVLGIHRAVPGGRALEVEYALIGGGLFLLMLGFWREWRARRSVDHSLGPKRYWRET